MLSLHRITKQKKEGDGEPQNERADPQTKKKRTFG